MKKKYERVGYNSSWDFLLTSRRSSFYKHRYYLVNRYNRLHTFNELRNNFSAIDDGYRVRGKRRNIPRYKDCKRVAKEGGKSWKDYTKRHKQYNGA